MASIPRAGVQQLTFGDKRLRVRSDVRYSPGGTQKEPGQGLDGHRYSTVTPRPASLGVTITVSSEDELLALEELTGQTTTCRLRDGGVIILEDSELSVQEEINIDDGSASVLLIGSSSRWLTP